MRGVGRWQEWVVTGGRGDYNSILRCNSYTLELSDCNDILYKQLILIFFFKCERNLEQLPLVLILCIYTLMNDKSFK